MKRFLQVIIIIAGLAITLSGGINMTRLNAVSEVCRPKTMLSRTNVAVITAKRIDKACSVHLAKTAKTSSTAKTAKTAAKGYHFTKQKGHHYQVISGKPAHHGHPGQKGSLGKIGQANLNGYADTAPTASTASTAATAATAKTAKSLIEIK